MKKRVNYGAILLIIMLLIGGNTVKAMTSDVSQMEANEISAITEDAYNIVLLIDKSGSMNRTDRDRMALSAACQFVDQLYNTHNDMATATNVSVFAFSQMTEEICSLTNLNSETNTNYIKSQINTIEYLEPGTGGTDLGTAIYAATEVLKGWNSENNKNMIVLFTDGYSENVLDEKISEENLEEALINANELECEVYIVGLNKNDSIKEEGVKEIQNIANKTQLGNGIVPIPYDKNEENRESFVNYLITNKLGEVREFYGHIYAKMIGSTLENVKGEFSITTADVLEIDITVYADSKINKVTLIDPDGNETLEDGQTCFITGDDYYKLIKVMEPRQGPWKIYVSTEDESYATYVVRFYGMQIAASAVAGKKDEFGVEMDSENVGMVKIIPMFKEEQYRDELLSDSFDVSEFTVQIGDESKTYSLTYDNEEGIFIGYFPINEAQRSYQIKATLSNDKISKSAECILEVNMKTYNTETAEHYLLLAVVGTIFIGALILLIRQRCRKISGEFHINIKSPVGGIVQKNTLPNYPRGVKFSLWKLIDEWIKMHSDEEKLRDIFRQLKEQRSKIAQNKVVICREKGGERKRFVYKLKYGQSLSDIITEKKVYESSDIEIWLKFRPENKELANHILGIPEPGKKNKKVGRQPSGKA